MKFKSAIAALKTLDRRVALSLAVLFVLAVPVFAHGGFDHVIGNVVKVSNNVVTIKTSTGNVDVRLNDQTEITKDKLKAQLTDLAPGVRVVVDIPEDSTNKTAHAIKIGASAAPDHGGHQ